MSILWNFLESSMREHQSSCIEEYKGSSYSYSEFLDEVNKYGSKVDANTYKNRKCIVVCNKSIECLKSMMFCWKIGMVAIPVSLHYGVEHCKKIIQVVSPDFILSDDENIDLGVEIPINTLSSFPAKCTLQSKAENLDDIELMMCTSGTTGMPKASMFDGQAIKLNCLAISDYFPVSSDDTILVARPLYHCAVLVGEVLISLYNGCNMLFFSNGYNPIVLSRILSSRNITVMCGTPTIFKGVAGGLSFQRASCSLKTIALSGEYLLPEYAKYIAHVFKEAKIFNVYGLTEAGPRVSYLQADKFTEFPSSVGVALKNVEISIVSDDESCTVLKNNEIGRIWVNTPCLMRGYYKDEAKTQGRMHGKWYDTGDVGYIENGMLYVVGRSDDMIIKSGVNIYPQEIESRILNIKEIKSALVYGIIVDGVEQICADVILQEGISMDAMQIKERIVEYVEGYMMPYEVNVVDDFRRNASGKVMRPKKSYRV